MLRQVRVSAAAVGVGLLLAQTVASADPTKVDCVEAADRAQSLQRQSKLLEARAALRICVAPTCPVLVQHDCVQWLNQADRSQPTIAFSVKDGAGGDRLEVQVSIDGQPSQALGGGALEVDPGEHSFAFSVTGQPTVTKNFVIVESERGRREVIVLGSPGATIPTGPVAPAPSPQQGYGTQRIVGIASMGVGGAALAIGAAFGALTLSNISDQKTDCPTAGSKCILPAEAASAHSTAITDGAISTTAFIAGGVLVATGVVLFLTGAKPDASPPRTALVPGVGAHGGSLLLTGVF